MGVNPMLRCSSSLWSADLSDLASEIRRIEPYSDRFHLDVADGHYVPNLLFFPDLVKALRGHTRLPFEIHLMTTDPSAWIGPFAEAGADGFIFCLDSAQAPARVIRAIADAGKFVGVSLRIEEELERLNPYWGELDLVTIFGTEVGIKGASMDASVPEKVRRARSIIERLGLKAEVEVDGGIRRESVPAIHAAGADWIVPGSLMFGGDPREMRRWLATL
jgi:ribulose-phosphate 3-epimerase